MPITQRRQRLLSFFIVAEIETDANHKSRRDNTPHNQSNIFTPTRLVQTHHVTEYAPDKTGEYPGNMRLGKLAFEG